MANSLRWPLVGAGGLILIVGLQSFARAEFTFLAVLLVLLGAGLIVLSAPSDVVEPDSEFPTDDIGPRNVPPEDPITWPLWLLIALGAVLLGLALKESGSLDQMDNADRVMFSWLAGLGLVVAATVLDRGKSLPGIRKISTVALLPTGMFALGLLPRLIFLDRFPTSPNGDEVTYLATARLARDGRLPNPFQVVDLDAPSMYFALEGWVSRTGGETFASFRIVSAVVGALAVLALFLLARRLFGNSVALVSAGLLALFPFHLYYSRTALAIVTDATVMLFTLYLFDMAVRERKRLPALCAGIVMGLGLFGYHGARALPIIVLAALALELIGPARNIRVIHILRIVGWMTMGYVAGCAPLLGFYVANPDVFMGRVNAIIPSADGSSSIVEIAWASLQDWTRLIPSLAFSFSGPPGFYVQEPPLFGWAITPFIAIGFVAWMVAAVRTWGLRRSDQPRVTPLLLAWVGVSLIVAQTTMIVSQRYMALTGIELLAAGTGVGIIAAHMRPLLGRRTVSVVLTVAVVGVGIYHAGYFFTEAQQGRNYGTGNLAHYDFAWRLNHGQADAPIVLTGQSFARLDRNPTFDFLVPDPPIIEFAEDVTSIPADGVLVWTSLFDPEQRCVIERENPDARIQEVRDRYGTVLYVVYSSTVQDVLADGPTPAESSMTLVEDSICR